MKTTFAPSGSVSFAGGTRFWAVLLVASVIPAFAQLPQVTHFVAPSYPPLARQALVTGQATVKITINESGLVSKLEEISSASPMLLIEARNCVKEWRFGPLRYTQPIVVVFYFGFSGDVRASDPRTTVKADFQGSTIHVYVTTDPAPNVHVN